MEAPGGTPTSPPHARITSETKRRPDGGSLVTPRLCSFPQPTGTAIPGPRLQPSRHSAGLYRTFS